MNEIEMYRGDSKQVTFTLQIDNVPYIPEERDRIFFTVKNKRFDPNTALIKKSYPEDISYTEDTKEFDFNITSDESEKLCPGDYDFDIKFKFNGLSLIEKTGIVGKLVIKDNVTRRADEV